MTGVLRAGLHLAALWALAVAQPLFDLLGESAEFFAVRDTTWWDIVLFAFGIALLPPAAIVLLERLAELVRPRLGEALHLLAVAALVALLALQAAARNTDLGSAVLLPAATLLGAAGALAYARLPPARTFVTVLSPVPLVFLVLFLVFSPTGRLVRASDPELHLVEVSSRIPVVLVVFDELSTVSLLDEDGEIDARRSPSFAALGRDATWFRNAATVNAWTTNAVPAILTGLYPRRGRLPVFSQHPDNLFTLLGSTYRLHVAESMTQVCPRSLCPDVSRRPFARRMEGLLSDAGLVYLHLALPRDVRRRLPPVSNAWGAFLESSHERTRRRLSHFGDFLAGLDGAPGPAVAFAHLMFPHHPWEFLPSGRRYEGGDLPGFEESHWTHDRFLVEQGYQRYLLQLGFADRMLGDLVRRLKAVGLYDRSLLIVVADHGVSFLPGDRRRAFTQENLDDVVFVPLLVKRPGQKEGRIVESPVQTVDILPTIAKVLGVRVPWRVDGSPLFGGRDRDRFVLLGDRSRFTADPLALEAGRDESLARQVALFGSGLYAIGPNRELVGRPLDELTVGAGGEVTATLDQAAELRSVDLDAEVVPTRLTGRVAGGSCCRDLAVAFDGRIAATARSYSFGGEERLSVLVPESALRAGANEAELFWVRPGPLLVPVPLLRQ